MSSLNLSDTNQNAEKSKVFTPNIYRKPIVKEEREKDSKNEVHSAVPTNYVPANTASAQEKNASVPVNFDIDELIQKEAQLTEIRNRYESDIHDYEEKQKQLDDLKKQFEEQEKDLRKKCGILKSASQRAAKAVPKEEKEKLEKEVSEFTKKRSEFESQVRDFESKRSDHEKELAEYNSKLEELRSLKSVYDAEFEEYSKKKAGLDEQRKVLEDALQAGGELSVELAEATCPAAVELIKAGFYAELKELNRKKADIESLKSRLEDEESILTQKRSSLEKIKEHIHNELKDLGSKSKELETSIATYEERMKSHGEKELAFQEKVKLLDEKKAGIEAEHEKLKAKHEETIKSYEEKETALHNDMKSLEEKRSEIEAENENIRLKHEENSRFEQEMEKALEQLENRRKELDEMTEKTNNEIGVHVTLHRQDLDIRKLNNKLEQQVIYIQSLEASVNELKKNLEEARSDVKKNEVFAHILRQNMELMG